MKNKLLLIFVLLSTLLAGCGKGDLPPETVLLKEVISKQDHFIVYADKEYVYLRNQKENTEVVIRLNTGGLNDAMSLPEPLNVPENTINVKDFGFVEDIPNTYQAPAQSVSNYLKALYDYGYVLNYSIATYSYIDIQVVKDEACIRIVVLGDTVKVFEGATVKNIDAATYINEIE